MKKLFRLTWARLVNRRTESKAVDLDDWVSILRSEKPIVAQLIGVNWFSQSRISLILEGPEVSLGAREDNPNFPDLLKLCSEVWPSIPHDFELLDGKFATDESFFYIRAAQPVSFKSATPPWYDRLDEI